MALTNKDKQTNDVTNGIAHVRMALFHFELAKISREVEKESTAVINEFINKLKYIDSRCKEKIKSVDQNNEMLTDKFAYKTGSIMNLVHQLTDEERGVIEEMLNDIAMGNLSIKLRTDGTF